jgi:dihydroxyacetone kinase
VFPLSDRISRASLADVYRIAQLTTNNIVSVGSSLEHVHIPGREIPTDLVPSDEVEVGMGIHNEPGSHRMKGADLPQLIKTMLQQMLDESDKERAYITRKPDDKFVLLINNLGGVSTLELAGITAEVSLQLEQDWNIKPVRIIQGTFLTSLNGLGFSASLLKLVDTGLGPGKSLLELLDAPAEAVGWAAPIQTTTWETHSSAAPIEMKQSVAVDGKPSNLTGKLSPQLDNLLVGPQTLMGWRRIVDHALLKKSVGGGLQKMIDAEPLVTRFDTIVGDGDCGVGLKRGAEAILRLLQETNLNDDVVVTLNKVVNVVEATMDGTSGAIYAIFLNALVHGLRVQDTASTATPVTPKIWAAALKTALTALAKYTPAQIGDRTMIDALAPFCTTLVDTGDVHAATKAAQAGTESTKHMKASLGRTVYVGGEEEWLGKIPDPGAYGLTEFLSGLAAGL